MEDLTSMQTTMLMEIGYSRKKQIVKASVKKSIADAQKMILEFELGYLRKWVYAKQGSQPSTTLERKNTGERMTVACSDKENAQGYS